MPVVLVSSCKSTLALTSSLLSLPVQGRSQDEVDAATQPPQFPIIPHSDANAERQQVEESGWCRGVDFGVLWTARQRYLRRAFLVGIQLQPECGWIG